ncbi:hypothetical protein MMC30_003874 [Trapelia coarctata]|nr:hypothetical protein [Trapelia coarctata]
MRTPGSTSPAPLVKRHVLEVRETRVEEAGLTNVEGIEPSESTDSTQAVSIATMEEWEKELMEDPKNRLALNALTTHEAKAILTSRPSTLSMTQTFNTKIDLEGAPITNQKSSGRCWLFAATNCFRVAIMRRHNLKKFELSQAYLFYWDKLEKANWFLEQILDTVGEELDGRLVQRLLMDPVGDGGQWDMVANLVGKYGLVPQSFYPDSFNATASRTMNQLITTKLRENALTLRHLASTSNSSDKLSILSSAKAKMLREIHTILTLMLGRPPSPSAPFTWEYTDKDEKFHSLTSTPLKFAAELSSPEGVAANQGSDVTELFSLVNDPRNPYMSLLTVSRLGNVWGARGITYINVPMSIIKSTCVAMLAANLPVFFGSDVGKFSSNTSGIMDSNLVDYELGFNIKLGMGKADRLRAGESAMTHAMVLTGVHVVEGAAVRWRVQNSWGEKAGVEGWFVMSEGWMDEWVYQAVVDPRFVDDEVRKVLDKKPIVLPLWDPMGALATN